jgi:2-amino-4-hydroxy-6-hydroxymethyldihydropteridine diphosphokinase
MKMFFAAERRYEEGMILIGIGGNLPSAAGSPVQTCRAALAQMEAAGVHVAAQSPWYETAPIPASDQPWFVNGVVRVETRLNPEDLLARLHEIEAGFGRARTSINAARPLDLDLLAYGTLVRENAPPLLPHPRLHLRAFVLLPLQDVAPSWVHPVSLLSPAALIAALPPGQLIRPLKP